MLTVTFLAMLLLAVMVAFTDWRRGWLLALVIGVLQDPARKLTPGAPVAMTLSMVVVYIAIIFSAQNTLGAAAFDLRRRFSDLSRLFGLFLFFLTMAAFNGLMTFGVDQWKVPALGFFIYCVPIPAVLIGYAYVRRAEDVYSLFRFYVILTSVAVIGIVLEYLRVQSALLGTVSLGGDQIRYLPGIQIRLLSGFYRSPDTAAWHAGMLCMLSLVLMIRRGFPSGWMWMATASWGFLCVLLCGRRKMLYMVAVFAVIFVGRYFRSLSGVQIASLLAVLLSGLLILHKINEDSGASVYAKGAVTSREEVLQRFEGGTLETFRQTGWLGLGLGAATQGTEHLMTTSQMSWQEGGLSKLAVELGLPGFVFVFVFAWSLGRKMYLIARYRDLADSPQMLRLALVAIIAANIASFIASHQPYSDPMLVLNVAFCVGALFATVRLADSEEQAAPVPAPPETVALRPSYAVE